MKQEQKSEDSFLTWSKVQIRGHGRVGRVDEDHRACLIQLLPYGLQLRITQVKLSHCSSSCETVGRCLQAVRIADEVDALLNVWQRQYSEAP